MTYEDFHTLCASRRSIRYFSDTPLTKEEVLKLLELAHLAPSIENLQPWHFHVIQNTDLQKQLMKASCYGNFVPGAGVFIVITANRTFENKAKQVVWNPKELEYSCMVAAEHVMLGATAMGLGSCFVSLHHGAVHDILELPVHETVVGGMMIGHYKAGEEKSSDSRQRGPLEETYTFRE